MNLRNHPCPCGSDKPLRACCRSLTEGRIHPAMPDEVPPDDDEVTSPIELLAQQTPTWGISLDNYERLTGHPMLAANDSVPVPQHVLDSGYTIELPGFTALILPGDRAKPQWRAKHFRRLQQRVAQGTIPEGMQPDSTPPVAVIFCHDEHGHPIASKFQQAPIAQIWLQDVQVPDRVKGRVDTDQLAIRINPYYTDVPLEQFVMMSNDNLQKTLELAVGNVLELAEKVVWPQGTTFLPEVHDE